MGPKDVFEASFRVTTSDTMSLGESTTGNVEQPSSDSISLDTDIPSIELSSDEIIVQDDAFGFVTGGQKTIYLTDERYIVKHDS